jgi:hypothetical protein
MSHSGPTPRVAPRIVALGMQGMTAKAIACRIGCNETYATIVLGNWRAEGGDEITRDYLAARQVDA